ncbi:MAG: bifunctional shikimate kinase/3-dehydroquinate synthase [Thermoleophilaceae bacterium]|nr:bifunctional shikimate kinase/3-dehydroquinate synthase [Thermoleophilaceae bacterium]
MTRHLVLTGFMGAGKSSAARRLAEKLGRRCVDSDELLELHFGRSLERVFEEEGEATFRAAEAAEIARQLDGEEPLVLALGGGALENSQTRELLAKHLVIYLEISANAAWRRVKGSKRPLAQDRDQFVALLDERRPQYERTAHLTIQNEPRNAPAAAAEFIGELLLRPSDTRALWAATQSWQYPAVFERGLVRRHDLFTVKGNFTTLSDTNLARQHDWLRFGVVIEPGETSKTLTELERVCSQFAERGLTRQDSIVAVGGGVVGDLAGFAAAVYQRGIDVIQVPTSLVAQVDSAYGGKTGVDLPSAKNYVGAYHQPQAVLVDVEALTTLPQAELAAGYAEVIKTALIAGGSLWEAVEMGIDLTEAFPAEIVFGCAKAKLNIVVQDERDGGRRQVLNLGHTIGHAIETAAGYGRMRHGEAVGIGLLGALRLSGLDGLHERVKGLLEDAGLPTTALGLETETVLEFLHLDKKRTGGDVPFVLVAAPGEVTHGHLVPQSQVRSAIEELLQ